MIFKKFKNKNFINKDCCIINMWEHQRWGNNISWLDFPRLRIYGHLYNTPKDGDILRAKFENNQIGTFIFKNIERCSDPQDMFFAGLEYINMEKK